MFARWGALVYRFRKFIVVISVLLAIASLSLASQTSGELSSGGWLDNNSGSAEVQRRLDEEFGAGKGSLIALFRSDDAAADAAPRSSRRPSPARWRISLPTSA